MRIALGGIVMNTNVPDSNGATWLCTGLEGWDSAEPSISKEAFATKDGVVRARSTYSSRALVLEGICKVSGDAYWDAYNDLTGVLGNLNRTVMLVVDEGPIRKYLDVYRAGRIQKEIKVGHFAFNVPLTAPDPIKYGDAVTVSIAAGSVQTINNIGNYPSNRILVTASSAGKFRIRNNDQSAVVHSGGDSVRSGTVFDFRKRTVTKGGTNRYHELALSSTWWTLDPGTNRIGNFGDKTVTLTYRPAWI